MIEHRKEFDKMTKDVGWILKKTLTRVVLPAIVLFIIIAAIFVVLRVASQPARIVEKTLDADNVLYNYEWFKQTYQDVKAIDLKIGNAKVGVNQFKTDAGPRVDWTFEDKNEYSRLNAIVLGLKNQREDVVAQYNARSKMANRAIFKSGELPEQLQ